MTQSTLKGTNTPNKNKKTTPLNKTRKEQGFRSQLKRFFEFLENNTCTCAMASNKLDIPQKNLIRLKRELELNNKLWIVKVGICSITRTKATYISTNPALKNEYAKNDNQMNLFD